MCSRYNLTTPPEAVRAYFRLPLIEPFPPRYNIAPTQPAAIVRLGHDGGRELALVRWGLIPSWVKDPAQFSTLINARIETAAEKPSFRGGMRHRRCLVPATGFYEWTGRPGAKQPHLIRPRDGELLAFAGIWESWLGADGSEIDTMAVLTVPALDVAARVHDRMPAMLPPELFEPWLDTRGVKADVAVELVRGLPPPELEIVDVSRRLNNPRNEGADLMTPEAPPAG